MVNNSLPIALIIGEKPSVAKSVSEALCRQSPVHTSKGFATPVHEFKGSFNGEPVVFCCTSVTGHVMNLDFKSQYNNWSEVDPKDLFAAETIKSPADKNGKICRHLKICAKNAKYLILWLDCDREGENICFEVIDQCRPVMRDFSFNDSVYRARFMSLTPTDINKAMMSLKKPDINESMSVDARQVVDLKVGVVFTRYQTLQFSEKYANLDSSCISYGPCQIPTLGFCVDRHDKIQKFVPKPYWYVKVTIGDAKIPSKSLALHSIFDEKQCRDWLEKVKGEKFAEVKAFKITDGSKSPPLPLNTLNLLKEASSKLLIGPSEALHLAEDLYLSGYTTYPRTESTKFPKSFDYVERIKVLEHHYAYGDYAANLIEKGHTIPKGGVDCGDHEPITPVKLAESLAGKKRLIYDLIARSFLASVSPNCTFKKMAYRFQILSETVELKATRLIDESFTALNPSYGLETKDFPILETGRMVPILKAEMVSDKTSPPPHISETELLSKMFKHGIGTDASMPTHIENIIKRNYVGLGPNRTLLPTQLGIVLVHGYKQIDEDLVLPSVRSGIEKSVDKIAKGQEKMNDVIENCLFLFEKKFENFTKNIEKMDVLFQSHFDTLKESKGKPFSRCGDCNRFMKLIENKPSRLFCAICDKNYKIPIGGAKLKLYEEKRCRADNFELLFLEIKGRDSYVYCPGCMARYGTLCKNCDHETCEESIERRTVKKCPLCEKPVVFSRFSHPKFAIRCTGCADFDLIFKNLKNFKDIKLSESAICKNCGAKKFEFGLKTESFLDCAFCCESKDKVSLSQALRAEEGSSNREAPRFPPGRARGRARGRGESKDRARGRGERTRGRGEITRGRGRK